MAEFSRGKGHRMSPNDRRSSLAWVFILLGLLPAARAAAQGSVTTSDGMRLTLGSTGTVSSFQSNAVEYGSSSILSGFLYREFPAAPGSAAPNGSFESGTTTP